MRISADNLTVDFKSFYDMYSSISYDTLVVCGYQLGNLTLDTPHGFGYSFVELISILIRVIYNKKLRTSIG